MGDGRWKVEGEQRCCDDRRLCKLIARARGAGW